MPRGGKRPGAGAPDGNYNALKHGRRSRQMRQLFIAMTRRAGNRALVSKTRLAAALTAAKLSRKEMP